MTGGMISAQEAKAIGWSTRFSGGQALGRDHEDRRSHRFQGKVA